MGQTKLGLRQLGWIAHNRKRAVRTKLIGTTIEKLIERERKRIGPATVYKAVGEVVNEEFFRYCALGSVEGGVLTILVQDVRLVYPMRLQWRLTLIEHLRGKWASSRVRDVRFVCAG